MSDWVLIVEDDLEIRAALCEVLEDRGIEVRAAQDGLAALKALSQASGDLPYLILLDLMMPNLDGRGFREQQLLNPAWAQIPVVVLSAYRDVLAASTGLRAVESLKKPVDLKDLLRVVREYRPHAA